MNKPYPTKTQPHIPSHWTSERILNRTLQTIAPLPSQEGYARALASIFSMHIHRNELIDDGLSPDELPAPSAIVVAPTGQGKTYLLRKMAEALELNVITVDCSTLVAEGFKGASLSERLVGAKEAAKSRESFERSILLLDEVDKLAKQTSIGNGMTNLLQLFNGSTLALATSGGKSEQINTSRFTVLLGGAFEGLDEIIQNRVCPKPKIGFGSEPVKDKLSKAELMQQATVEDLVKFGLMRELLGRIGTILSIPPLGTEDYRQLLNAETGSLRKRYHNYLSNLYGVSFEITERGVEAIAQKCMAAATGARAVNPIVNDLMRGAIEAAEAESTICKITLDADEDGCCLHYEHGPRSYAFRSLDRVEKPDELPWHPVKANNLPALTRKLCRYYRNAGGNPEHLPQLEAFLNCTLMYLFAKTRPDERTFESLEKLARVVHRSNPKSPYDIIMGDACYLLTPEYKAFDKLYDSWMQRHLVSALQTIMGYIQEKHGVCCVRLEAKHLPPQRIR